VAALSPAGPRLWPRSRVVVLLARAGYAPGKTAMGALCTLVNSQPEAQARGPALRSLARLFLLTPPRPRGRAEHHAGERFQGEVLQEVPQYLGRIDALDTVRAPRRGGGRTYPRRHYTRRVRVRLLCYSKGPRIARAGWRWPTT
jgi:hypothetical protein